MPKFTTTLTANTYTATDFSTTLKTAFDNLGWGTGKVDIVGGYRYTSTDESNSATTPYSLTTFLENYNGNNIVRPHLDWYGNGEAMLAAYLPGVKSYRIKFTVLSETLANGTSVSWGGTNNTQNMYASYYNGVYNSTPSNQINSNYPIVTVEKFTNIPSTLSVGTQYTTNWTTGRVTSAPGVMFHLSNVDYCLRIDAIEWTVDQNKFAFQSPNLDSPTFEVYSVNAGGTLHTTLVSFPIKNANTPIAKLGVVHSTINTNFGAEFPMKAHMRYWNRLLFHTHTTNFMTRGRLITALAVDTISFANFATDTILRVGSNNTYDGFFVNTQQGSSYQGTSWDTVDKSTAFPNATPQFPPQRILNIAGSLGSSDSSSPSNGSYHLNRRSRGGYLFNVLGQRTFNYIKLRNPAGENNVNDKSIMRVIAAVYKVTLNGSDVTYDSTIVPPTPMEMYRSRNLDNVIPGTENITLQSGYYVVVIQSSHSPYAMSDLSSDGGSQHVNSLDVGFMGKFNFPASKSALLGKPVRYIRDYTRANTQSSTSNLWVELKAVNTSDVNVALNKTVTSSEALAWGSLPMLTNGDTTASNYMGISNSEGGWVQVDLGQVYNDIKEIIVYHYSGDGRYVHDRLLEISSDGVNWISVFDATVDGPATQEVSTGTKYTTVNDFSIFNASDLVSGATKINSTSPTSKSAPFIDVEVEFSVKGAATPTSTINSYAENWCSFGRTDIGNPSANMPSKPYRSGGDTTGVPFFVYFPFGLDVQMKHKGLDAYYIEALPGYELNPFASQSSAKNIQLEFSGTMPTVNGATFHRAWATRPYGISLRKKNTYIYYKSLAVGSSFTTPDGSEYVCVAGGIDYPDRTLLFRLR